MARKHRKVDELTIHEALDRTRIVCDLVYTALTDHAGVKAVPKASAKINRAAVLLEEAYQLIGGASMDLFANAMANKKAK